jgi:hypothetical protein
MVRVETARIERSESLVYRGNIVGVLAESVPVLADRLVQSGPVGAPGPAAAAPVMVQPGKPNWPLWVGGLSLAGALVAADSSADKDDEAQRKAELARQENNPALFAEAQVLNQDAARMKNAAYVLGAVGIGLIAYHLLSDAPDPGVAGARPLHEAPAWNVGLARGVLAARYAVYW